MRLRYTATACAEIDEVLSHITEYNPSAAAAVGAAIKAAASRLRHFPHIGAETDEAGVRMKIGRPFRYLIFYSTEDECVVIRNVRHPARRQLPII